VDAHLPKRARLGRLSVASAKPKPARGPKKAASGSKGAAAEATLCAYALTMPGAVDDFPWGHRVAKVNKKIFVTFGNDERAFSMSVKLPRSAAMALTLPFAEPTGYGLGKSGWVTARFAAKERPPLDMLRAWIDESYRAIAPAKLVATLPEPLR
jgi:predicted DNA-binding protein (MmcQ/YjbR family)